MQVAILQDLSTNKRFWRGADAANADARYTLLVAPTPHEEGGGSGRLLVFLDADAAVSNFDLAFEWASLSRGCRAAAAAGSGGRVAGADNARLETESLLVLMCKEGDGGSIANTGIIVARDVPATQEFLLRWWAAGDSHPETRYGMRHEQSALDRLISQDGEMRTKVGIAEVSAFNTAPPFYKTHTAESFILHLMFEPYGGLRRKVLGELAACITRGDMDHGKKLLLISRLPALAEEAYAQGDLHMKPLVESVERLENMLERERERGRERKRESSVEREINGQGCVRRRRMRTWQSCTHSCSGACTARLAGRMR